MMHVVFISNSKGAAERRVRAVLDAYATRIGESAWATPITTEALEEVYKALKKGISRHTSVACYRNYGYAKMRLLWIVGNKNCYDSRGAFAPETRSREKPFPMAYRHAALIAGIAGYAHDLGKANKQFQNKISGNSANQTDGIRHEWISAWLFRKLVESDALLLDIAKKWSSFMENNILKSNNSWMPVQSDCLQSPADAIALLVATHHYAFGYGESKVKKTIRRLDKVARDIIHVKKSAAEKQENLKTLNFDPQWEEHAQMIRKNYARIRSIEQNRDYWHGVTMMARAALILADHEVSAIDCTKQGKTVPTKLYANTTKKNGQHVLNQDLLWHLQKVGDMAKRNIRIFANDDLPSLSEETICNIMKRNNSERFRWQDIACDAMPEGPALVFNVASTGAGKTRANVKLICALRKGQPVRISSTFNLRTLTLQTFDAYTKQLGLRKETECACLIGDPVVRVIHESLRNDTDDSEKSEKTLIEDTALIETNYEIAGADKLEIPQWLRDEIARFSVAQREKLKKLLATPVLVSTIDFLNAAGDMTAPNANWAHCLIRMAHSDLILDEVDSYDPESVVAVLRLVHIAAMFGRNVVISSATLSKTIAEYAFKAYLAGNRVCRAMCQDTPPTVAIVSDLSEPKVFQETKEINEIDFGKEYENYVNTMATKVSTQTKRFYVAETEKDQTAFFRSVNESINRLHEAHGWILEKDGKCGPKVSVGLVRVARIETCIKLAGELIKNSEKVHVVAYHARDPLLRRAFKEYHLDQYLNRKNGNETLIKGMIEHFNNLKKDWTREKEAIFVVVATPVEEVGRDHDFDWAVIEPSSMHSIIQTAGRVNRHRLKEVNSANIAILNRNFLEVKNKDKRVFYMPGNEIFLDENESETSHPYHDMTQLLGVKIDEEKPLDIRLMFGEHKTKFAEYDEQSIHLRLEQVIDKYLTANGHVVWFSKWFGEAYPLRNDTQTLTCAVTKSGTDGRVAIMRYIVEKNEWNKYGYVKDCNGKPPHAWLSPTIAETVAVMSEKVPNIGEKEMSFSLYGENLDEIVMDWRGVCFKKLHE